MPVLLDPGYDGSPTAPVGPVPSLGTYNAGIPAVAPPPSAPSRPQRSVNGSPAYQQKIDAFPSFAEFKQAFVDDGAWPDDPAQAAKITQLYHQKITQRSTAFKSASPERKAMMTAHINKTPPPAGPDYANEGDSFANDWASATNNALPGAVTMATTGKELYQNAHPPEHWSNQLRSGLIQGAQDLVAPLAIAGGTTIALGGAVPGLAGTALAAGAGWGANALLTTPFRDVAAQRREDPTAPLDVARVVRNTALQTGVDALTGGAVHKLPMPGPLGMLARSGAMAAGGEAGNTLQGCAPDLRSGLQSAATNVGLELLTRGHGRKAPDANPNHPLFADVAAPEAAPFRGEVQYDSHGRPFDPAARAEFLRNADGGAYPDRPTEPGAPLPNRGTVDYGADLTRKAPEADAFARERFLRGESSLSNPDVPTADSVRQRILTGQEGNAGAEIAMPGAADLRGYPTRTGPRLMDRRGNVLQSLNIPDAELEQLGRVPAPAPKPGPALFDHGDISGLNIGGRYAGVDINALMEPPGRRNTPKPFEPPAGKVLFDLEEAQRRATADAEAARHEATARETAVEAARKAAEPPVYREPNPAEIVKMSRTEHFNELQQAIADRDAAEVALTNAHQAGAETMSGRSIETMKTATLLKFGKDRLLALRGDMPDHEVSDAFHQAATELVDARERVAHLQSPEGLREIVKRNTDHARQASEQAHADAMAAHEAAHPTSDRAHLASEDDIPAFDDIPYHHPHFSEEAAMARWNAERGKLTSGINPAAMEAAAIIGAHKLIRIGKNFGAWAKDMVGSLGKAIGPHLRPLWDRAVKMALDKGRFEPDMQARQHAAATIPAERASIPVETLRNLQHSSTRNGNDVYALKGTFWEHTGMDKGRAIMTRIERPTAAGGKPPAEPPAGTPPGMSSADRLRAAETARKMTTPGPLPVGGEGVKGDPNFKLGNLAGGEAVKRTVATTASENQRLIDEARRGTISQQETVAAAVEGLKSGKYTDEWLLNRKRGTAPNAEEQVAGKALLERHAVKVQDAAKPLVQKIDTGTITDVDLAKFAGLVEHQTALHAKFAGGMAEVGRALNAAKWAAALRGKDPRLVTDVYGNREAGAIGTTRRAPKTPEQLHIEQVIADMGGHEQVKNLIRETAEGKSPEEIAATIHKMTDPTTLEKVMYLYKAGMVSSLRTISKISIGQRAYQVLRAMDQQFGAMADAVLSSPVFSKDGHRSVGGLSVGDMKTALKISNTKGLRDGWKILTTGETPGESRADGHSEMSAKNWAGNKILQAGNLIFRSHSAAYRPVYEYGLQMSLGEMATIRARNEIKDGQFSKSEFAARKRHWYDNPDDAMSAAAVQAGQEAILTQANIISKKISTARRGHTGADQAWGVGQDLVMPFTRVPTNMGISIADHTGVGQFTRLAAGLLHRKAETGTIFGKLDPGEQRAVAMALGRGMSGMAVMMAGAALARAGLMTGARALDAGTANRDEIAGKTPNSLKVGGSWVNVGGYEPVAALLSIGATLELNKKANLPTVGLQSVAAMPLMQGTDAINSLLHDPEKKGERFVGNLGKAAVPTFIGDFAASADSVQRNTNGGNAGEQFLHSAMSKIPGLRQMLPPKLDAWGNPLEQDHSQFINPSTARTDKAETDPLIREVVRLKVDVPKAPTKVSISNPQGDKEDVHLTPTEHGELLRLVGEKVHEIRASLALPSWASMSDADKADELKTVIRDATSEAEDEFKAALQEKRYPAKR